MWILIAAVASASLLGSMHCVGMCGPLAIWASGATERPGSNSGAVFPNRRRQIIAATALYHIGRLVTYALAGWIAGAAGGLLDSGGQMLGVQLFTARIVGGLMVLVGLMRLRPLLRVPALPGVLKPQAQVKPSLITRLLVQLRPLVFRLPLLGKGFATGLLTAFLPCGWLYLFALVAAGTGSMVSGSIVMVAFWLGTVPALVGLVAGTQVLAIRFRRFVPAVAALLLIVGGCYTAAGRGFAQLGSLAAIRSASQLTAPWSSEHDGTGRLKIDVARELQVLVDTPLPCCAEGTEQLESQVGAP